MLGKQTAEAQVVSRRELFEQNEFETKIDEAETEKMDAIMQRLMGIEQADTFEEGEEDNQPSEEAAEQPQEDGLTFRLFASQPVVNVSIAAEKDNTDDISRLIAEQQIYEFDDTDPTFLKQVQQAAVDYDTIIQQSATLYPAMQYPKRVIYVSHTGKVLDKNKPEEKDKKKKRKSKKRRAFEKAVKEGKIKPAPKMRNPGTPNGWPGWPGNRTRVDIINYQMPRSGGYRAKKPGFRDHGKPFAKKPLGSKPSFNSTNRGSQ